MEELKEYFLQKYAGNGEWKEVVKSYENTSLIHVGKLREERGEVCRVLDNAGIVFWQAEGALVSEDAQ